MNARQIDPWQHILRSIEPEIDQLKDAMERSCPLCPVLVRRRNKWEVTIQQNFPIENYFYPLEDELDEAVEWSFNQLKNWKEVTRTAHDSWEFKRKRDAEKFQVIFNLKWAK